MAARQTDETQGPTIEQLMAQLVALQTQTAEANKPKENPDYKVRSPFMDETGESHARKLPYDIYVNNSYMNKTPLTLAECAALLRLKPIEKGTVMQMDGTPRLAKVEARHDAQGRLERISVTMPGKKDDNPNMYPAITVWAAALAEQADSLTAA